MSENYLGIVLLRWDDGDSYGENCEDSYEFASGH